MQCRNTHWLLKANQNMERNDRNWPFNINRRIRERMQRLRKLFFNIMLQKPSTIKKQKNKKKRKKHIHLIGSKEIGNAWNATFQGQKEIRVSFNYDLQSGYQTKSLKNISHQHTTNNNYHFQSQVNRNNNQY